MTDFVVCYIEGKRYPRASCHKHHKNPRHAGGSDADDNLVWLSANAHQLVHRASQMIKASKAGHARDLAMAAYQGPAQRQRFLEVVAAEVKHSREAAADGLGNKAIVIEVPIPRPEYAKLKLLVSDRSTKGNKLTIKGYVASLVLEHIRKSLR